MHCKLSLHHLIQFCMRKLQRKLRKEQIKNIFSVQGVVALSRRKVNELRIENLKCIFSPSHEPASRDLQQNKHKSQPQVAQCSPSFTHLRSKPSEQEGGGGLHFFREVYIQVHMYIKASRLLVAGCW